MRRLDELGVVWALMALDALAVVVTYARLPADELYNVSGSGLGGGFGRALVELNFPAAFAALAILGFVVQRLPPLARPLALVAAACCVVAAIPGVLNLDDLDARPVNAVPAVGVALALVLWLVAPAPVVARDRRGDRVRVALLALCVLVTTPWIAAELGFYLDGVPLLGWIFQTGRIVSFDGNAPHHAVHHGVHHGWQGLLLVASALLLSRRLPELRRPLQTVLGAYLALMLAYGLGNIANDGWLEQVAERGWTHGTFPSVLHPAVNWGWLTVLAAAGVFWLVWFRYPAATAADAPTRPRATRRFRPPLPAERRAAPRRRSSGRSPGG